MNKIDFENSFKNYSYQLQTQAARGMLGCHLYKQIIDRTAIYLIGTTLLFGAATVTSITLCLPPIALIVFGINAITLLAVSIGYIVHRLQLNQQGKMLEPVYQAILNGAIASAYSLYNAELQKAGAGTSTQGYQRLCNWFSKKPYFDPIEGWDATTRKEFFFEFSFNLTVLAAIQNQQNDDYDKFTHQIDAWYGPCIPDGSKRIRETLQLREFVKTNKQEIKFDRIYNTGYRLQEEIADIYSINLKPLQGADKIPLNTQKYIQYANQYFPNKVLERFAASKTVGELRTQIQG